MDAFHNTQKTVKSSEEKPQGWIGGWMRGGGQTHQLFTVCFMNISPFLYCCFTSEENYKLYFSQYVSKTAAVNRDNTNVCFGGFDRNEL